MEKPKLAQDDFDSLVLDLSNCHNFSSERLEEHSLATVSRTEVSCGGVEKYTPENFIPDSVHELIRTWQESHARQLEIEALEIADDMSVEPPAATFDHVGYDEMETEPAPPKKFYRTFWKSATRRLLQAKSKSD
jgi:hypothetical protein